MAVNRMRGNGGLYFQLKRGTSSAVVFEELKAWNITYEERDDSDVTFAEAQAGIASDPVLTGTAVTQFEANTLFKYLWDNAGAQDIAVTVGPKGNVTATADKPHFTFTASIPSKPELSNEASADPRGAGAEFEFTLNGSTDVTWKSS